MHASGSSLVLDRAALELEFAEVTDVGRSRDHNEDYFGHFLPASHAQAQSHGWLFCLADGVGGQEFGEVASRAAVESALSNFAKTPGGEGHAALLRRLIQAANHDVYELGRGASPGGVAMATTFVACAFRYDRVVVAHVGDSRCYRVRGGHAVALTKDHTVAAEQMRLGVISSKEGGESSHRHLLTRSLGNDLFVSVDTSDHSSLPGDVFLMCSDGLHNSVGPSDLARALNPGADLLEGVRQLVALANERDGGDNITVSAVRVRNVERMGMYRGRPYRLR